MNSNQIDNTDYYRLPCGRYLEDYIHELGLSFAEGSALKYMWRAGKKDGESCVKDMDKCAHYVRFIAERSFSTYERVRNYIESMLNGAREWNGGDPE